MRSILPVILLNYIASTPVIQFSNSSRLKGKRTYSNMNQPNEDPIPVDQFFGIPFAHPPTGSRRFRPPEPLTAPWSEVREFTTHAKGCYTGKEGTDEDCLYLNVYRPSDIPEGETLPVMVWIYGGGFVGGKTDIYDGTELAAREKVIVVVPAYRLGAFGFLASQALLDEHGTTGNYGILDQQLALKWVRDNIQAFGGDPSRVVIFGESAGAMSVAAHLVIPGSRGLFSAAILQSGTASSDYFFQESEDSFKFSAWVSTQLARCSSAADLDCLRSVDKKNLIISKGHRDVDAPDWASRLFPLMPWGMTIDGSVLKHNPLVHAKNGEVADVPVIIGVTQDEGSAFSLNLGDLVRPSLKGNILRNMTSVITRHVLGDDKFAAELLKEYPLFEAHAPFTPAPESSTPANGETIYGISAADLAQQMSTLSNLDLASLTEDEILRLVPVLASPQTGSLVKDFDRAPLLFFTETLRNCMFACPSMDFARAIAQRNGGRVYFYNFDVDVWAETPWSVANTRALVPGGSDMLVSELGAFHSSEIPFVFNMFPTQYAMPNELANPSMLFKAYTAPQFCPADSFKRTVASQLGCLWANMAKCNSPQCESSSCGLPIEWLRYGEGSVLNIGERGEYEIKNITRTGRAPVRSFMPSHTQCNEYSRLKIPFFNFAESNGQTSKRPVAASALADNSAGIVAPGGILTTVAILTTLWLS